MNMKGKYTIGIMLVASLTFHLSFAQGKKNKPLETQAVAKLVLNKGLRDMDLSLYPGSLLMHGMSELAVLQKDDQLLNQALAIFGHFKSKKIDGRGSFISYKAGGSGAAYLDYLRKTEQLSEQVRSHADKMFKEQKRSSEGILTAVWVKDSLDQIFIDIAFAVTPYLLYAGLRYDQPAYVDAAVFETLELFKILQDPNGLIHQARGFTGLNIISEDNWSRGNGWGAFALATLVRDLPDTHPRKKEVNELAKRFFQAVLKFQDQDGLWHQEMSDPGSYVETSGTGLLLFGIGIAIEKNILDRSYLPKFTKGLSGYLAYINPDGSVSHTCAGCLNPGKGTKQDYMKKMWEYNDHHAFGPVVLAFTQAAKLGIKRIKPLKPMGCYAQNANMPRTYLRYLPEANQNIAWENDRIAFRVYGPVVKDRVSSGIDVWTKSVSYPIIDKWHKLNAEGKDYHEDRGDGCDFFHVGFGRGNGGTAIWFQDKPHISQPYTTHKVLKNTPTEIAFELTFAPWEVAGFKVSERKVISMTMGTNFFKVVSTFDTDYQGPLTIGIGISYAKTPEIITDQIKGLLSIWEPYQPQNGELGTSIIAKPSDVQGFKVHQKEQFILLNARAGKPMTYYVGAGWSKSPQFKTKQDWLTYVEAEISKLKF
jgi:rhamnogalacturonyl hydrolase YesR